MIIIINGSLNAGKSTVAKMLSSYLPRTAHIEKSHNFIEWMTVEEVTLANLDNIVLFAKNSISMGSHHVIISYPIPHHHVQKISTELEDLKTEIYAFTLSPRLDVITSRGERALTEEEIEQIEKEYEENFHKPDFGITIDNSHQTPEETARVILDHIGF